MSDPASDFLAALQAAGLAPAGSFVPRSDGRLHRYRLHDERPGKRSGWYVLHPGDPPHGHAGDWRTDNRLDWIPTEVNGQPFDRERWEAAVRRKAADEKRQWDAAPAGREPLAAVAAGKRGPPLSFGQAGCRRSGPHQPQRQAGSSGLRRRNRRNDLTAVHCRGWQQAFPGRRPYPWRLLPDRSRRRHRIIICEGFATGATIQAATGDRVACAFSAGNLHAVAEALQKRFPTKRLLLAADNDDKTAGNPGISKAFEASLKLGISWVSPPLPGDFNDLGIAYGHEAVRVVIDAVTDPEAKKQADALFGPNREPLAAAYERLAKLDPGTYDRLRASEAKRLGVRASTLDEEVRKRRRAGQKQKDGRREGREEELSGRRISLFDPQPDAVAIDGASLIDALKEDLRRYLVLSDEAATIVAFWMLFAYTYEAFSHCPRLSIVSPTKNCGKSTLVDWLAAVLPRALVTENLTVAVLFRVVDAHRAIMIIDEADKILLEHTDVGRELLAMLNAGWKRPGLAFRCEGDNHEPRGYSVFAPAVMAGIKERPPQITERSHRVVLSRASNDEFRKLKRFRQDRVKPQQQLAKQCARWAQDNIRKLEIADPELPDSPRQPRRGQLGAVPGDRRHPRWRLAEEDARDLRENCRRGR